MNPLLIENVLASLRQQLPALAKQYAVKSLAVFGSCARREASTTSDVDVLVTFTEPPSLLTFLRLENQLADSLGVKVDLVLQDALRKRIGERILREKIPV